MIKKYSELIRIPSFEERYQYLKLSGSVGAETFGADRLLNQIFYTSPEWKQLRQKIIVRDNGCDLAHIDRPIRTKIYIHHINPITVEEVMNRDPVLFDEENLVCTTFTTHQAIHYGDQSQLIPSAPLERTPNDQSPWRKEVIV